MRACVKTLLALIVLALLAGFVALAPEPGDVPAPTPGASAAAAPRSAGPTPAPPSRPASAESARAAERRERIELVSGGETMRVGDPPAAFAARSLPVYRYSDGSGVVRLAEGLDAVPPAFRHRAEKVTGGKGAVRGAEPGPLGGRASVGADRDRIGAPAARDGVVLFSVSGCAPCERARQHLDEIGVRYRIRDVHSDSGARQELERVTGMSDVPLLRVGSTYVLGYLPREYERLSGSAGDRRPGDRRRSALP